MIKLYAQLGLKDPSARDSFKENLNIILDQAAEAIRLTENMKTAMADELISFSDSDKNNNKEKNNNESQDRMQVLLSNLPGFAYRCIKAPGWPMDYISEGFYQLTGYDPDHLNKDHYFEYEEIIHPDDRRYVDETVQECVENGLPFTLEYRIITKGGIEKLVWEKGRQISGPGKDIIHLEGFIMDVSDRKQIEEALKLSEEKYSKVFNNSQFAILISGLSDGLIVDVNPGCEKFFGHSREESIGNTSLQMKYWVNLSDRDELVLDLQQKKEVKNREYTFRHKSGEIKTGLYSAELITINEVPCILASISDITEIKKAEAERKIMEDHLIHSQKMEVIGKLAGGVAHEFNNTLQVINTLTELSLIKLPKGHATRSHLEQILTSVRQSSDLVGQLLAFARKQAVNPEVLNLNEFIIGMLIVLQRLIGEKIVLKWEPDEALWPVELDPVQLNQVLINLTLNARDAIESSGTITISTSNDIVSDVLSIDNEDSKPGEYAMLSLADTGCGMDDMTLSKIFEPFFTTKPKGKGTGLGLATVYGIIRQNKGFIVV
ncbi:MAG: PAS domain S-box protein, partial [Bacteroidales bacterium]|nr:PAS domain S-box protein [Bacteroidales bacterium]